MCIGNKTVGKYGGYPPLATTNAIWSEIKNIVLETYYSDL